MIGGATMAAVMPAATTPSETTQSASSAPTEPSSQPANATSADPASAKPAKAEVHDHAAARTPSSGDDTSDFERMLEPEAALAAATAATAGGSAKPAATDETKAPEAPAPAAQNSSLADQLLGLLGMLGPPAAAPPPATGNGADTPVPAASAPATTTAAAAMPTLALAQPATGSGTPITTAAAASDTAHAVPGVIAAEFIVARATHDGSVPTGGDPTTISTRDPANLAAPTPMPIPVDRLPLVPQPALTQPASPDAGYGEDLGSSVMWMAEHRVGHASMQVSPDHLGPIEVRLQLDGARVHAEFYSAQPEVRHALEASLPRLRELLGQQGLQLGQADVGQRQRDSTPRAPMPGHGQSDCFPDDPRPLPTALRRARGLVDEYA